MSGLNLLSRESISDLLNRIGKILADEGVIAEVAIFGGSAIALMFDFRDSTQDVDYIPVSGDVHRLAAAADSVGGDVGLGPGWFNDAIEIFASENPDYTPFGEFPIGNPGIRVFTASPEYLFAMKTLSMRSSLASHDVKDVWHLIDAIGLDSAEEGLALAEKFYPGHAVPTRNRLILEDVFEAKKDRRPYSPMMGW